MNDRSISCRDPSPQTLVRLSPCGVLVPLLRQGSSPESSTAAAEPYFDRVFVVEPNGAGAAAAGEDDNFFFLDFHLRELIRCQNHEDARGVYE